MGARRKGRKELALYIRSSQACGSQKGLLHSRSQCKMHPGVYLLMSVELSGSGFCACTSRSSAQLGKTPLHQHGKAQGFCRF